MNVTILVGNGRFNNIFFSNFFDDTHHSLIAADGGANHLKALDIIPQEIIGDLDSLENQSWWEKRTTVTHVLDQHSTDIEKCLNRIPADIYIIYGASGDRLDHTFEILHLLKKYADKRIIFVHDTDVVFVLPKQWSIDLPVGTRLSLYPLAKTKALSSTGLRYPIDNLIFEQGTKIGTSNETTDIHVEIILQNRGLVCILPIEFLSKISKSIIPNS